MERAAEKPKIDRLSSLPDCLLHHILSFLDMKHVVRTGILSSRWRAISTSVSHLNFDSPALCGDEEADFVRFVDGAIRVNSAPTIHKFRVSFSYHPKYSSQVDAWILFAVRKGVQELELDFRCVLKIFHNYQLPSWLSYCTTLISLKLQDCMFGFYSFATLNKLTSFTLVVTSIKDGLIENVLKGCPLLEDLDIFSGHCTSVVKICSSSSSSSSSSSLRLKRLRIEGVSFAGLDIEAPNLEALVIGISKLGKFSITNMEFLEQASIGVSGRHDVTSEYISSLKSSLPNLRHARVLTLDSPCVQVISNPTVNDMHSYFYKTKCLRITVGLQEYEMQGMANLLWSSPDLEDLIIQFGPSKCIYDRKHKGEYGYVRDYWESTFPCLVYHLKTIHIIFFDGQNNVMKVLMERILLARFFLKHAMVLESMSIHNVNENWRKTVADFLIDFPRASSRAKILFL